MPELPELEVVRDVLQARITGRSIARVTLSGRGGPIVTRDLIGSGFAETLAGARVEHILRQGKFVIFNLQIEDRASGPGKFHLAVNPKLSGTISTGCAGS